jgi:hypothetical protein
MSRRRPLPPPPPPPPDEDEDEELLDDEDEDDVEYFVDDEDVSCVLISVPKSAQSSHTSSSAPSILTVFGDAVSAPHISHWTIPVLVVGAQKGFPLLQGDHRVVEPLQCGDVTDDGEEGQQPADQRQAVQLGGVDGRGHGNCADDGESVRTTHEAAVNSV